MKSFLLALALLAGLGGLAAQSFDNAVGVRLGYPFSGSFKHFFDDNNAGEAVVGFSPFNYYSSFSVGGYYQRHEPLDLDDDLEPLQWYYGGGAAVHFWNYDDNDLRLFDASGRRRDFASTSISLSGMIGLQYAFEDVPLEITVDWRPTIFPGRLAFGAFRVGRGGLAVRYILGQ